MKGEMKKGYLYVFEGPDGVGKTTLVGKVFEDLAAKDYPVAKLSFPGKGPGSIGSLVYQVHHDPKSFNLTVVYPPSLQIMHIAAHADAIKNNIFPLYGEGTIILLDRYWWSTIVYGRLGGVQEDILKSMIELELHFWKNIRPDTLFLLDRESPLKKDEDLGKWMQIKSGYTQLSREENGKYPIVKIHNNDLVEHARDKIISEISKNF